MRLLPFLTVILPRNLVSYWIGVLSRLKRPRWLVSYAQTVFVTATGVDLGEAEVPAGGYPSLEALFSRRLRPGQRPLSGRLVSPADGQLLPTRVFEDSKDLPNMKSLSAASQQISIKGLEYSAAELLNETAAQPVLAQTVYLAPHNYHRVHSPVSGHLERVRYIPGDLWPVNGPMRRFLPKLYERNERLVFNLKTEGGHSLWLVMVGSFNVGRMWASHLNQTRKSITDVDADADADQKKPDQQRGLEHRTRCQDLSNLWPRQFGTFGAVDFHIGKELAIGEELGGFKLGSTVVVLYDHGAVEELQPRFTTVQESILLGQPLT